MKNWSSLEAADRYHRAEGFLVGWDICPCGAKVRAAIPPDCKRTGLECLRCGKFRARFVEDNAK